MTAYSHGQRPTLTRAEWAKIHRDYKGTSADGFHSVFAGALPDRVKALISERGTVLVPVTVEGGK